MPELPEVQTIVNDLNRKIKSETVANFWSDWEKGVKGNSKKFAEIAKQKKILGVRRIGKNILLDLSGGYTIIIHLRMTGTLIMKPCLPAGRHAACGVKHDKHIHHKFYFKSGKALEFSDVRKFGSLELVKSDNLEGSVSLTKLGIDALSPKLTFREFDKILKNSKTKIKQILLNQERVAGIGNIYASEILHEAGISPARIADNLTGQEKKKLFFAMRKVLQKAVRLRGTSISDYRDASGRRGRFQDYLKVYGKAGQKCRKCGIIIKRLVIGQRSTFHCPKCQK